VEQQNHEHNKKVFGQRGQARGAKQVEQE